MNLCLSSTELGQSETEDTGLEVTISAKIYYKLL
jgi:hypothetical protein